MLVAKWTGNAMNRDVLPIDSGHNMALIVKLIVDVVVLAIVDSLFAFACILGALSTSN